MSILALKFYYTYCRRKKMVVGSPTRGNAGIIKLHLSTHYIEKLTK